MEQQFEKKVAKRVEKEIKGITEKIRYVVARGEQGEKAGPNEYGRLIY